MEGHKLAASSQSYACGNHNIKTREKQECLRRSLWYPDLGAPLGSPHTLLPWHPRPMAGLGPARRQDVKVPPCLE